MKLQARVELDGDVEGVGGECINAATAADGGSSLDITTALAANELAEGTKGAALDAVALEEAVLVLAGPAAEVEASVDADLALDQVAPVPPTPLLVIALVVGVAGAREGAGTGEAEAELNTSTEAGANEAELEGGSKTLYTSLTKAMGLWQLTVAVAC